MYSDLLLLSIYVAIVKSMTGSPDKVTSSIDINRIPVLYDRIVASLKRYDFANFDFLKQVWQLQ